MEIEENNTGSGINYISFNREGSRLAIGTNDGFKVYQTNSKKTKYPLTILYQQVSQINPCNFVKVLGESHLFVWVGTGEDPSNSQRKLNIYIAKSDRTYPYYFITPIIDVKLEQTTIIVVLETKIHIYEINNKIHPVRVLEQNPNPKGLCDLAITSDGKKYLAYPKSALDSNEIIIYDIDGASIVRRVQPANIDLISTLSFNRNGSILGVVDQYGCNIEVFSMAEGGFSYLFRRGNTTSIIRSISFNNDSSYLVASSDSATIHIFKLTQPEGWRSLITESQVSCAKIPKTKNEKCICSFLKAERNQLVVASESGKVSYFKIIEGEEKPEQLQEFDVKLY